MIFSIPEQLRIQLTFIVDVRNIKPHIKNRLYDRDVYRYVYYNAVFIHFIRPSSLCV